MTDYYFFLFFIFFVFVARKFELVEVLDLGGEKLVDVGTRDKGSVTREQFESVLRADKHRSTSQCQNMATRTSRNPAKYIVSDDNYDTVFNRFQIRYEPLNLNRLQYFIDSSRIDPSKPINMHTLYWSGAVGKIEHGVKLLADVRIVILNG